LINPTIMDTPSPKIVITTMTPMMTKPMMPQLIDVLTRVTQEQKEECSVKRRVADNALISTAVQMAQIMTYGAKQK